MRTAIFYTPPPDHPLTRAAVGWLGRDAFSGTAYPPSAGAGMTPAEADALTEAPRRYGFHATLKAPFRLRAGCRLEEVEAALQAVSEGLAPVELGRLRVAEIGAFLALVPASGGAIGALADEVVRRFDMFRMPPGDGEIARRRPHRLSSRQRANLERWGYPYVFADFRFHMTLTGPVADDRRPAVRQMLEKRFQQVLDAPVVVDALALFVEPSPPGDFLVRKRIALSGSGAPSGEA